MARPKLTVTHVFLRSEVVPYDGSSIEAVHATLEGAQEGRKWYEIRDRKTGEIDCWATVPDSYDGIEAYQVIRKEEVRV